MPTLDDAIRSDLANAGLTFGARVYFHKSPERPTEPYVTFQLIDVDPLETQQGPPTLRRRLYQFSAFSQYQSAALAAVDEVRARYDGYRGTLAGVDVRAMLLIGQRMFYEDDTKLFNAQVDLRIQYVPA